MSPSRRDARVVAGREVVGVHRQGAVEEGAELDVLIAGQAGVGRAAALVLRDEVVDDLAAELLLEVHRVVRDSQHVGRGAGVIDVLDAAAALLVAAGAGIGIGPQTHRDANDVVALAHQQARRDGGIDAATHRHDHALLRHHLPSVSTIPSPERGGCARSMCRSLGSAASRRPEVCRTRYNLPMSPIAYSFDGDSLTPLAWQPRRTPRWAAWKADGAGLYSRATAARLSSSTASACIPFRPAPGRTFAALPGPQMARRPCWLGIAARCYASMAKRSKRSGPETGENLRRVAWHPDGAYALIVGNAGTVLRYDAATGRPRSAAGRPGPHLAGHRLPAGRGVRAGRRLCQPLGRLSEAARPLSLRWPLPAGLLGSDDEDDFVAVDWPADGLALVAGYGPAPEGAAVNKLLLYDGSIWRGREWPASGAVLGAGWQAGTAAMLSPPARRACWPESIEEGGIEELDSGTSGQPDRALLAARRGHAIVLKGPGDKVYTV